MSLFRMQRLECSVTPDIWEGKGWRLFEDSREENANP